MYINPTVQRRLMREIAQLRSDPPEGIRVVTEEDNVLNLVGIIAGPENTPYEGGYFRVKFSFTDEFPTAPPKCWFSTKIFHPNVSKSGEICVNTLKKDWKPTFGIGHILVTIKCLLIYPNPESALDDEAGKLLLENYDDYCSRARIITQVHATPKTRPPEFEEPRKDAEAPAPVASASTPSSSDAASASRLSPAPSDLPPEVASILAAITGTENVGTPTPRSVSSSGNPLQPSNANQPAATEAAAPVKPPTGVKRPATSAIDKRKKALKRL
ncbi:hypothetical protein AURDEDRAFT_114852 [Auricularia subglabra TFB-10046 SS5]|nr:hypothetical protein AURDEDRAFT_114852 [Auricularia subglabra TFB-10046 SS5]